MKKPVLVQIKWKDAAANARWMRESEVDAFHEDPFIAHSVGWEVRSDETGVTLAQSVNAEGWWGSLLTIPRGMVVKRTRLKA